ncbi:MAG: sulfatase-like hydrolase/transferase [bacterium]|nr:sulfatase-like hydrolase/transferase [bacterium]
MSLKPDPHATPDDPPVESDVHLVLWVVPLIAVILIPGLVWMIAERPMAARVELALAMTGVVALTGLLLLAAVSNGFRRRIRWSTSVATMAVLVAFQWPTLTYVGRVFEAAVPLPFLADAFPVILAVAFLWVATRIGGEWPFAAITGFGTWLIVVVLLVNTLPYVDRSTPTAQEMSARDGSPDVVLIVMDGYTRADILETQFGFDTTPWLSELEQLGFQIATEARPNYSFTYASIASMLDLDYAYPIGPVTDRHHETMRNSLAGNGALPEQFRERGYEFAYVENAWQGSHCGAAVDICIRDGLVERVLWNLGQVTIMAPILTATRPHPFNTVSLEQLESLPTYVSADRTPGVPRLTFAHLILPHPPFLLNAECERQNTAVRRAFTTASPELIENRRDFYVAQATCTNHKLLESLQQIIADRPDTVIMITGDHGSGSTRLANEPVEEWSDAGIAERMSILSAYRMPGCESFTYPSITPVNGARAMTNCVLDVELDFLDDAVLWSPNDGKGSVTDIAPRLSD